MSPYEIMRDTLMILSVEDLCPQTRELCRLTLKLVAEGEEAEKGRLAEAGEKFVTACLKMNG